MAYRRVTLRFACGDSYAQALSKVTPLEVVDGTVMPDTFGVTYAAQPGTPAATTGIALSVGQPLNMGPRTVRGAGWRLDEVYFRNTSAGSNGFVTFVGVVDDLRGAP